MLKSPHRSKKRKLLFFMPFMLLLALFIPSLIFRAYYQDSIYKPTEVNQLSQEYTYGIVLGAGTNPQGEPNMILKDRLDSGAILLEEGKVDFLILSGSNDEFHNEVDAMREYLIVEKGIDKDLLIMDGFGYRTYDSCMRAVNVYNVDKAYVITTNYHLPRSLYLCETAGMQVVGFASSREVFMGSLFYMTREVFATHKALLDTWLLDPQFSLDKY